MASRVSAFAPSARPRATPIAAGQGLGTISTVTGAARLRRQSALVDMIEHEALAMLLAQQAGVPVPHVVTVGRTIEGDAVLVTERAGTPLSAVDADVIDDDHPAAAWHGLLNLHAVGLAHGRIDRDRLLALGDGTAPGRTA